MLLVIVNNLYVGWPRRLVEPLEANPPLIINADAILALAVAYQSFKPIARQRRKVPRRSGRLETVQFQARGPFKSRKCPDSFPSGEISGPFVPIADDHCPNKYHQLRVTSSVKRSFRLAERGFTFRFRFQWITFEGLRTSAERDLIRADGPGQRDTLWSKENASQWL